MKFALIDAANLFNRAHHVCTGDAYTKATASLHIIFQSLYSVYREHSIDHMVICGEGRSWRHDYYPKYKSKRYSLKEALSPKEKEETEVYHEVLADFMEFVSSNSRCSVIQTRGAEGDDIIARFVQLHPNDDHVIVSGDSDMIQLVDSNVSVYNGITHHTISNKGVVDSKGKSLVFNVNPSNGKLKIGDTLEETLKDKTRKFKANLKSLKKQEAAISDDIKAMKSKYENSSVDDRIIIKPELDKLEKSLKKIRLDMLKVRSEEEEVHDYSPPDEWTKLALFIKCIRGDTSDSIFSSYPGIRYKGTAKKVGIEEAWNDRHTKSFPWNNFMLQTWDKLLDDGTTETVRVIDEYNVNEMLIDLTRQPDEVKEMIDAVIVSSIQKEPVGNVGIKFLQFCHKYDLARAKERANDHIKYLNAGYL